MDIAVAPQPSFLSRERSIASPAFNRWLVPPAALAIHLCIGMAYGFSVFWLPLRSRRGWAGRLPETPKSHRRDRPRSTPKWAFRLNGNASARSMLNIIETEDKAKKAPDCVFEATTQNYVKSFA
jgi:hypothetical protein